MRDAEQRIKAFSATAELYKAKGFIKGLYMKKTLTKYNWLSVGSFILISKTFSSIKNMTFVIAFSDTALYKGFIKGLYIKKTLSRRHGQSRIG